MSLSFKLKLLRDDIELDSIPTVSSSAILNPLSFTRKTPQDIVNEVRVSYALRVGIIEEEE